MAAGSNSRERRVDRPESATFAVTKTAANELFGRLRVAYPDAHCELSHEGPFQLLVATVLSAQSTDVAVNRVTPRLFRRWPSPSAMAAADLGELEQVIGSLGMFRQKARHLIGLSRALVEKHRAKVPARLDELVQLAGVGRKTANVVLGVAFGAAAGVVVDTHVQRLAQRLGWTKHESPLPIEEDLMRLFPSEQWDLLSHTLIFHGRRCCTARAPACSACPVSDACPAANRAERVGRKGKSTRGSRSPLRSAQTRGGRVGAPTPGKKSPKTG
jgi:endonuclease III